MNEGKPERKQLSSDNLEEVLGLLKSYSPAFHENELAAFIGLTPEHLKLIIQRERSLRPGIAHKITEYLSQFPEMVHIQSPLLETEVECPLVPRSDFDKTIQNITQKAAGSMALLSKIKEPLPNTAFDQLPDEEKMQYLELAGILSRFLVKFGQYSQIKLIDTDQFESIIQQLTLAKLNKTTHGK